MSNEQSNRQERGVRQSLAARLAVATCVLVIALPVAADSLSTNAAPDLAELSLEELANIEVTSVSKKAEPLHHAPAAIHVITGEDIRRAGVTSIPEALRLAPGLQVARINANNWAISSRGFNDLYANKLLVLIDGRSVYTPLFAGVFWDMQDVMLEDIDRIEVIRGPGATLWGANAVNGVINITTKSSKLTQGVLATAGYGTEEQGFGAVRYGGHFGDHGTYRIYGKYFNRDNSVLRSGDEANDQWEAWRSGFRTDWEPSAQNLFTFQGDIFENRAHQTYNRLRLAFPFAADDEDIIKSQGANLLGRWIHTFSPESDFRAQAYYDRTSRKNNFFKEDRDTFDAELQYRFNLFERNDIVVGAGYRYSDSYNLKSNFTLSFVPSDRQTDIFNTFVQDEITLVEERLALILGSKFEYNDYTHWEIQPSGRVLWTPTDQHSLWAAVSRAVRTPSRVDNDLRIVTGIVPPFFPPNPTPFLGVIDLRGNDDTLSEVLMAYEIGYRVQPQSFLSFDLALFYNDYDRLITLQPAPADTSTLPAYIGLPLAFVNDAEGETYGGELAANWSVTDWWMLRGSYSYIQMQIHEGGGGDTQEGATAHHQVVARSLMDLPFNLQLDITGRYIDSLPAYGIDSYVTADVRLGWRPIKNLDISIVGQNLLDNQHAEFGSSVVREQQTEVERAVYGKVTWTF